MTNQSSNILVSVLCPTYNQVTFIRQCLDSVINQRAPFEYEVLINDDHSTDGTAEIVEEYAQKYPQKIRSFLQTDNQFSQGIDIVRDILLPQAQGKYIAICEGDDYWIRTDKLLHQVQIFENEPETGLVYTYFHKYDEQNKKRHHFRFHEHEGDVYAEILASKCSIWYVSTMMRKDLMLSAPKLDTKIYFTGDVFWYYWITSHALVRLLREYTSVYRLLNSSVSHFMDKRKKIDFFYKSSNTRLYFIANYPPKSKPSYGRMVAKKSLVNCFKYALLHGNYEVCKQSKIPFLPLMSLKKTIYWFVRKFCYNEVCFLRLSELYNRHIH